MNLSIPSISVISLHSSRNATTLTGREVGDVATLPTWLDFEFVRTATGVLAVIAVIVAVVAICSLRSVGTRIVITVAMAASVVGLLHYRDTLDNCDKNGCECKFLGENLAGGGCSAQPTE